MRCCNWSKLVTRCLCFPPLPGVRFPPLPPTLTLTLLLLLDRGMTCPGGGLAPCNRGLLGLLGTVELTRLLLLVVLC
jgi:hypothetical protein